MRATDFVGGTVITQVLHCPYCQGSAIVHHGTTSEGKLRTRIKRLVCRTMCFSKTTTMHDLVLGLFINRYECGLAI